MTSAVAPRHRWQSICLWPLRVTTTLAAATYLFQAVSAGQFLDGDYAFLHLHQLGTTAADLLMFAALVSAAGLKWIASGPLTPFLITFVAMLVSQGQAAAGAARIIWLHVPLGVVLIGLVWVLAWGTWGTKGWQGGPR